MAGEKVTKILLVKSDLSVAQIEGMSDAQAWREVYKIAPAEQGERDRRAQICFTGFRTIRRKELVQVAGELGLRVVASVTKGLSYLVCGESAGQKKIDKALLQGVEILNEKQFQDFSVTGELPKIPIDEG